MTTPDDEQGLDPDWSDLAEMRQRARELLEELGTPTGRRLLTAERCVEVAEGVHRCVARYVPVQELNEAQALLTHLANPSPAREVPDAKPWVYLGVDKDQWIRWCMTAAIAQWPPDLAQEGLRGIASEIENAASERLAVEAAFLKSRKSAIAETAQLLARIDHFWNPLTVCKVTPETVRSFLLERLNHVVRKAAFLTHTRNLPSAYQHVMNMQAEDIPDRSEWDSWQPPAVDTPRDWVDSIRPVIAKIAKKACGRRVPTDVLISDITKNLLTRDHESARHPDGSRLRVGDRELEKFVQQVCNNAWRDQMRCIWARTRRELADDGHTATSRSDLRTASEYIVSAQHLTFVDTRRTCAKRLAELWRQTVHESAEPQHRRRAAMILEAAGCVVERALAHDSVPGIASYTAQVLAKGARSDGASRTPLREILWQQSYVPRGFGDATQSDQDKKTTTTWLYHDTNERTVKKVVRAKGLRVIAYEILVDELDASLTRYHAGDEAND